MNKLTLLLTGLLWPWFLIAQPYSDSTFKLKVNFAAPHQQTKVYLLYQTDGQKIVDSALLVNGWCQFTGKVPRPLYATLVADTNNLGLSGLMKRKPSTLDFLRFYLHQGVITIKTDKLITKGIFQGSVINTDKIRLETGLKDITDKKQAVSEKLIATSDVETARILGRQLDSLNLLRKPILKRFITDNPKSEIALFALEDYAGSFPDAGVMMPMFKKLSLPVQNSTSGKEFYKFLTNFEHLAVGAKAPEFIQADTLGKPISLASFKGKYVLLDFWASWCGPCRQENPGLSKLYRDFKDRNFTILGISLDGADGKQAWLNAIKNDHLDWTQVSDLKHWDNQVAKLYGIRAIPYSFLIDPDGNIMARGLDHDELRKLLEDKLPKK